jgi:hypothetical protein
LCLSIFIAVITFSIIYDVQSTQYSVPSTQYPALSIQYSVPSTQYSVPSTQYPVPSTQYPVLSTQYPVFSTQYSVPSTQYPVLSTQYSVLSTQHSVPSTQYPGLSTQVRRDCNDIGYNSIVFFQLFYIDGFISYPGKFLKELEWMVKTEKLSTPPHVTKVKGIVTYTLQLVCFFPIIGQFRQLS